MLKERWTLDAIDALKNLREQGHSLKGMAKHLNRTPTSVNKALTRFSIRPILMTKEEGQKKKRSLKLVTPQYFSYPKRKVLEVDPWVSLAYTLEWLKSNEIILKPDPNPAEGCTNYWWERRCLSPLSVVKLFNTIRLEQGLHTCWVEGISWE